MALRKQEEEIKNREKIRIQNRRKAQLKGKTISRIIQRKRKPVRKAKRVTKKRSSIS